MRLQSMVVANSTMIGIGAGSTGLSFLGQAVRTAQLAVACGRAEQRWRIDCSSHAMASGALGHF